MDKRTKNRIREHAAHTKTLMRPGKGNMLNHSLFLCECKWFGWIRTVYADDFAKVET